MDSTREIVTHLERHPPFQDLGATEKEQLASQSELFHLPRGSVLYLPGDAATFIYIVASGRAKLSQVTRDGKALTLGYTTTGGLVGEDILAPDCNSYQSMAEIMTTSTLIGIPQDVLREFVANHKLLGSWFTGYFAKRQSELHRKLETLIFRDVPSKLAEQLLHLAGDYGISDSRGTLLNIKVTHQELANLIGSTRETVSLTLSHFKKKGWIAADGRRVILADLKSLRALF